jgi:hypothetical protein
MNVMPLLFCRTSIALLSLFIFSNELLSADWPQWRGPNRDGIWNESGIISEFNSPKLELTREEGLGKRIICLNLATQIIRIHISTST